MKYYTKEWYNLKNKTNYTCGMKKIPDKNYTEKDIKNFYNKALEKHIREEKRFYNEPPYFLVSSDQLDAESFCAEDWLDVDEESGTCRRIPSFEDVKLMLEKQEKEALMEYENRPPFNQAEAMEEFNDSFRGAMKSARLSLPEWVFEEVDKRLIALDILPESVLLRLKQEEKENKRIVKTLERKAKKKLDEEWLRTPEEIYNIFAYNDECILSLTRKGRDVIMVISNGYLCGENETPYDQIIFRNVTMFEREKGLRIKPHKEHNRYSSNCYYLEEELYRTECGGYEFHLMVSTSELKYITIECQTIDCEKNIEWKYVH